ncbi:MAG: hypothetical protein QOG67_153 [Verrucomicrobiota bacterium]|jgi:hypothetical protein
MTKHTIYWLRALLFTLVFAHMVAGCTAITLDEISLMLRSGFSSETIIRDELVPKAAHGGRVYGSFDAKREEEFKRLNASPALIEALKSGKYAPTRDEVNQFRQEQRADAGAVLQLEKEQTQQRRIAQQAAQADTASRQNAAAQAEANLNQRVINALSTPKGEFGGSPDQQHVYARAKAIAQERFPPERAVNREEPHARDRRELIDQLTRDEAFVRETLR